MQLALLLDTKTKHTIIILYHRDVVSFIISILRRLALPHLTAYGILIKTFLEPLTGRIARYRRRPWYHLVDQRLCTTRRRHEKQGIDSIELASDYVRGSHDNHLARRLAILLG